MLLVSQERRRLVLIRALEIALGINDVNESSEALHRWSDLVQEFRRGNRVDAQALLQHLKSGSVLVCALQPGAVAYDAAEPDKAPA